MFNKVSCSERLMQASRIKKIKQVELCEMTGIKKSAMSQYFKGTFEPKQDGVFLLAEALDVSEAWLMGYDVPMERKRLTAESGKPMNDDKWMIMERLNKLSPENYDFAIAQLDLILDHQEK